MKEIQTKSDLDLALLERKALEEIGAVARRWVCRLPEDSEVRALLSPLQDLAAAERPQAA